jgi:hypothetical protein
MCDKFSFTRHARRVAPHTCSLRTARTVARSQWEPCAPVCPLAWDLDAGKRAPSGPVVSRFPAEGSGPALGAISEGRVRVRVVPTDLANMPVLCVGQLAQAQEGPQVQFVPQERVCGACATSPSEIPV